MTLHHEWRYCPDGWAHAFPHHSADTATDILTALGDCYYLVPQEYTSSGLVTGRLCLACADAVGPAEDAAATGPTDRGLPG